MMQDSQNIMVQEDNDIRKIIDLIIKNYKLFIICVIISLLLAFLINKSSVPIYKISASMLIQEESGASNGAIMNDYLNSNIFGTNQNFQNELWVLKSTPVIEQTIRNLDLSIGYCIKKDFLQIDAYKTVPFKVLLLRDHIQPIGEWFYINIKDNNNFHIDCKSKLATFSILDDTENKYQKEKWSFETDGKFGEIIETPDMAFMIMLDTAKHFSTEQIYGFVFSEVTTLTNGYKEQLGFNVIQKDATIVEITLRSPSVLKAKDILNELMNVYSQQNLDRKNHIASITIDYIDKQLNEISDSLSETENDLQSFRSSRQLLNVNSQSTEISGEYRSLQNQLAELLTRKRYYDYLSEDIISKENYSELILPSSMGIQDQLLNNLMSELISAHAQRSNLIQNHQEKNPIVQKLTIQIENTRRTISENISAVRKTTDISIDEMDKRIRKIESEISRMPKTELQLGGIQRKYRLNDAIYNYLLEKRAEAKITQASNLPDNIVIEPAKLEGSGPFFPNKRKNYLFALVIGLAIPFGFVLFKSIINNKLDTQDNLKRLTDAPILGKILHNRKKTNNIMFELPKSVIAESFRSLRTNIEFYFKDVSRKVILVTSSTEGEGKSFNALNLAMSYAQLNRRTILLDIDLRKSSGYFAQEDSSLAGLSTYITGTSSLDDIIFKTSHEKLDYILSGPIPPNPVELLAQGKIQDLLDQLKESYDCIIMDSTPLAQVSDAYLLFNYADIVVVIARYNYTMKKIFSMIMADLKQKGIKNMCVVLNDNRIYRDQYGYRYGYNNKKSFFK